VSVSLTHYLSQNLDQDEIGKAVKDTILSLCNSSKIIAQALSVNGLTDAQFGDQIGGLNADGERKLKKDKK